MGILATFLLVYFTRELTYNDGINFPFNLQGAAITAKDVSYLFQLCLLDQQVMFLLKVLLQVEKITDHPQQTAECNRSSIFLLTFHTPLSTSSPQAPAKRVFSGQLVEEYSESWGSLS